MPIDRAHYMNVRNGRFDSTTRQDLSSAMRAFADSGKPTLVIHFHGGLVDERRGMALAERLKDEYGGSGYPFFVVWESGLDETLVANLREIFDERIFRRLLVRILQFAVGKVREERTGVRSAGTLDLPGEAEIADELHAPVGDEPFEDVEVAVPEDAELSPVQVRQLEMALKTDAQFQAEAQAIANSFRPPAEVAAEQGMTRGATVRVARHTLMDPELLEEVRDSAPSPDSRGFITSAALVRKAVATLRSVIRRFASGRDHGLHATAVEEILRSFYLSNAGKLVWDLMKKDTADAFGGDGGVHGGTALLDELDALWKGARPDMRVVLVGHSTGAIYISHLLRAAAERSETSRHTFDVVFLAPAVTFRLLADTLEEAGDLIGAAAPRLRVFGMSDDLEKRDVLVPVMYPHSLLYFVSGVCEDEVDEPLVGMERYLSDGYREHPHVRRVTGRLTGAWGAWAATDDAAPDGWRTLASSHGGFDDEATTLDSVRHLIADGY